MCAVSFIGDEWSRRIPPQYPWAVPNYVPRIDRPSPTQEEFEALKREVEALRELLKAAKKYDAATGQPDCEMDEKVALLKRIAEAVGIDLTDVLGPTRKPRSRKKPTE